MNQIPTLPRTGPPSAGRTPPGGPGRAAAAFAAGEVGGLVGGHGEAGPMLLGLAAVLGLSYCAFRAYTWAYVCTEDALELRGFVRTLRIPRAALDGVSPTARGFLAGTVCVAGTNSDEIPTACWQDARGRRRRTPLIMLSGGRQSHQAPWQLAHLAALRQWADGPDRP